MEESPTHRSESHIPRFDNLPFRPRKTGSTPRSPDRSTCLRPVKEEGHRGDCSEGVYACVAAKCGWVYRSFDQVRHSVHLVCLSAKLMFGRLYLSNDQFPDGGKMTTGFHQLQIDDEIELKGPTGSFIWEGKGVARWRNVEMRPKKLGLICGGSGMSSLSPISSTSC